MPRWPALPDLSSRARNNVLDRRPRCGLLPQAHRDEVSGFWTIKGARCMDREPKDVKNGPATWRELLEQWSADDGAQYTAIKVANHGRRTIYVDDFLLTHPDKD